jgi:hypothetical protein
MTSNFNQLPPEIIQRAELLMDSLSPFQLALKVALMEQQANSINTKLDQILESWK